MILYLVLFFPGTAPLQAGTQEVIIFSAAGELVRIFTYTIPAMALIWHLILEKKSVLISNRRLKIRKVDAICLAVGFPGLGLISAGVSFLAAWFAVSSVPPKIIPPGNTLGWVIMAFSCIGTGYLEESFFRFYLLRKLENWVPSRSARILFGTLLFAICHNYEGLWGILNAAFAGLFLSILYEKYKTLHGLAWSHGLYNIFVYIMGIF